MGLASGLLPMSMSKWSAPRRSLKSTAWFAFLPPMSLHFNPWSRRLAIHNSKRPEAVPSKPQPETSIVAGANVSRQQNWGSFGCASQKGEI